MRRCDISATGFNIQHAQGLEPFPQKFSSVTDRLSLGASELLGLLEMRILHLAFVLMAFSLAGCISDTLDPVPESAIPARDRKVIASATYLNHKPDSGW